MKTHNKHFYGDLQTIIIESILLTQITYCSNANENTR